MAAPLPDPVKDLILGPQPVDPAKLKALLELQYPPPPPAGQRVAAPLAQQQARVRFQRAASHSRRQTHLSNLRP